MAGQHGAALTTCCHPQVNVDIAAPQGLRGTYAAADMPQGSHLAVIPERLVYVARKQATFNAEVGAGHGLYSMMVHLKQQSRIHWGQCMTL
jgi:hypothetical protein